MRRLRRSDYIIWSLLIAILQFFLYYYNFDFTEELTQYPKHLVFSFLFLVFVRVLFTIGRLHDINYSGWYVLLKFVPIINLVLEIILWVKDGTKGSNKYGKDPKNRELYSLNKKEKLLKEGRDKELLTVDEFNKKMEEINLQKRQFLAEERKKEKEDIRIEEVRQKQKKLTELRKAGIISEEDYLKRMRDAET